MFPALYPGRSQDFVEKQLYSAMKEVDLRQTGRCAKLYVLRHIVLAHIDIYMTSVYI